MPSLSFLHFCCAALMAASIGCYSYSRVPVQVLDASSHQPVVRARVSVVCDIDPMVWFPPRPLKFYGETKDDGVVTVRRAEDVALDLRAEADGYENYRDWYFDTRRPGPDGRILVLMQRIGSPPSVPSTQR